MLITHLTFLQDCTYVILKITSVLSCIKLMFYVSVMKLILSY